MVSKSLSINVSSYKLAAIFKEFKELPVWKYKNIASGSLRVFLDLAVDEFIETQNLRSDVSKECKKRYEDVTLQQRLKFLVETHITDKKANKVIRELLQHSNQYSLDTLNNYIHGKEVHHVERRTLNKFWDMLVPLFVVLIDLKAK
ncbi:hypothetical protein [Shewanella woodyi]|uniref:hypothetical protein n=1 Tax=Shewanella woodyi TaxID=60961 RepID=UPI00374A3D38